MFFAAKLPQNCGYECVLGCHVYGYILLPRFSYVFLLLARGGYTFIHSDHAVIRGAGLHSSPEQVTFLEYSVVGGGKVFLLFFFSVERERMPALSSVFFSVIGQRDLQNGSLSRPQILAWLN